MSNHTHINEKKNIKVIKLVNKTSKVTQCRLKEYALEDNWVNSAHKHWIRLHENKQVINIVTTKRSTEKDIFINSISLLQNYLIRVKNKKDTNKLFLR